MSQDHYRTLGVPPEAGHAEIRAAYLRVMRAHHPDRRPGDPRAAQRSAAANAAWRVLRDSGRRAAYDRTRRPVDPARRPRRVTAGPAAYSGERGSYQRALDRTIARLGVLGFCLGLVALVAFTG